MNRRNWLRGAAGFTLALPYLASLEPKSSRAAPSGARKRFVAIANDHGGVRQTNLYPADATLVDQQTYANHAIRRGTLALQTNGETASLSPVLSGPATKLTPALAAKMNLIRGFDVTFYMGHNRGGHLGNYADNDGNLNGEQGLQHLPTIDQVLAWSPTFYPDLGSIKERSLVVGDGRMSWARSEPTNPNSAVQSVQSESDSRALFDRIFVPPEDPALKRKPIVDLVFEDYQRLKNSNRRLSTQDRQRVDVYMDRVAELQRKLNVSASCGDVAVPTMGSTDYQQLSDYNVNPGAQASAFQLLNDVIVAAFACDTSRIATIKLGDWTTFTSYAGSWHQDIAHQAWRIGETPQETLVSSYRRIFEDVFLDLMAKLDAVDDGDGTLLDATLMHWTHESGPTTHDPIELPVITAGSAGGFFKTGQYVDYRDLQKEGGKDAEPSIATHIGLVYNQWLGTVLQSMGLAPEEYETDGNHGYGAMRMAPEEWYAGYQKYDNAQISVMGEIPPFLKA